MRKVPLTPRVTLKSYSAMGVDRGRRECGGRGKFAM